MSAIEIGDMVMLVRMVCCRGKSDDMYMPFIVREIIIAPPPVNCGRCGASLEHLVGTKIIPAPWHIHHQGYPEASLLKIEPPGMRIAEPDEEKISA